MSLVKILRLIAYCSPFLYHSLITPPSATRGPGDDVAIDVNVISVNALGDQYDHVAKLSTAADAKNRKFKQACAEANINFIPLVFNTYGAIHQESGPEKERDGLVILNQATNRYASLHDMSFPEAKLRIITRISFALKRGVVDQLCRRLPITDPLRPLTCDLL